MLGTFTDYLKDVKSQLCCNNINPDFITFDYTESEIDENSDYFHEMWMKNISGYKALTFLCDELNQEKIKF